MTIKATWILKDLFKYTRRLNAYFKGTVVGGMFLMFLCAIILFFFVKCTYIWILGKVCKGDGSIGPINKHVVRGEKQKTVSWRDEQGDGAGLEDIRYI